MQLPLRSLQSVKTFLFLLLLSQYVSLSSAEAHPHAGKVTPFQAGDPGVKLNGSALKTLSSGKPYSTQIQSASGGRGIVVQDVQAPVDVVWGKILDFNHYDKMVPKTAESEIYKTENLRHGQKRIWVRMKVGFPMLKLQFFVKHLYDPKKHSMTWTLDYSKKSDFDDSAGYWYVVKHPDRSDHTRVYYSVEVSMFPWVPQFVMDFMSKQALTDATGWVKKVSELEYVKQKGGVGKEPAAALPAMSKQPWWKPRKAPSADDQETGNDETVATATEAPTSVRATRIALVSTVVALSAYNVHLYFSQ
jgi:ribosome-associated toxin RatA of RatAB toxin-antitoxin module